VLHLLLCNNDDCLRRIRTSLDIKDCPASGVQTKVSVLCVSMSGQSVPHTVCQANRHT
jgi:hypothetical protein